MATPRRKWSTKVIGWRRSHPSKAAAYRFVQGAAEEFRLGMLAPRVREVEVLVDERDGHGWRLYERIDLADYKAED